MPNKKKLTWADLKRELFGVQSSGVQDYKIRPEEEAKLQEALEDMLAGADMGFFTEDGSDQPFCEIKETSPEDMQLFLKEIQKIASTSGESFSFTLQDVDGRPTFVLADEIEPNNSEPLETPPQIFLEDLVQKMFERRTRQNPGTTIKGPLTLQ